MTQMSDEDVERRLRALIGRVFQLSPEEAGGALQIGSPSQWDSFGHMQLLAEVENEFRVHFETHELAALTTVEKIVEAVREHGVTL